MWWVGEQRFSALGCVYLRSILLRHPRSSVKIGVLFSERLVEQLSSARFSVLQLALFGPRW
jgi:hypothetical protein